MSKTKYIVLLACLSSSAAIAQESTCKSQSEALDAVTKSYQGIYDGYSKEGDDLKQEGEVFVKGKVDWADTKIVFDTPSVTMKNQKIVFGLPQVTVNQRDIIFDTPSVRMERQKTGQYPEFFCEDTWIKVGPLKTKGAPKCTVKWSNIYMDVPVTFMERQKIIMGVPEFKWDNTEVIMGIPEFRMQRQNWTVGLPQFTVTGWAINSKKIQDEASDLKNRMSATQERQSKETADATHAVFGCYRDSIVSQKKSAASVFDASLVQLDAVIDALRSQKADPTSVPGADGSTTNLLTQRADLVKKRDEATASFDAALLKLDSSEKETLAKLTPQGPSTI